VEFHASGQMGGFFFLFRFIAAFNSILEPTTTSYDKPLARLDKVIVHCLFK
jgi:hypothetical protein